MSDLKCFKELKNIVDSLNIFDSHEHLMYESERRQKEIDFFIIFNAYTSTSMISAGLKEKDVKKLRDPQISPEIKWQIFSPYWELIKHTDDATVIKIAAADIFEVDEINLMGIKKINEKIRKFNNSDYYKQILNEKCRIKYILNDIDKLEEYGICKIEPDYDYFLPVIRLDYMMDVNSAEKLNQIEKENDTCINRFSDFLEIVDAIFEKRKEKIYALKTAIAYSRSLNFEMVTYSDAEKIFVKILNLNNFYNRRIDCISQDEIKILQDYIWHYMLNKAIEYNLPVQIHTGILDENANDIRNSNPTYLINLFLKYKNATFDIFHLGYPYTDELITIVKTFPNVYMNMCWIPQFSSQLYKNTLKLLIDILPANKIFGFGGDYLFLEGTYSAQKIAKDIIAKVLSKKVTEKRLSIEEAAGFAERLLYKNAVDIYLKYAN
ncbi:MAG: amidohydrolase [Actinobacteria bacterium]|nr:amidohydrolase [Actinomycetota bacterium]